jgi:CRISPR-associated Csx10 family RAMP protein
MGRIKVKTKVLSPIFLGEKRPYGFFLESLSYLPGSVLMGRVAEILLSECGKKEYKSDHKSCPEKDNCNFFKIFMEDDVLFSNLYPSKGWLLPKPFLQTTVTCKKNPGFISEEKRGNRHATKKDGVFDTLISQIAYDEIGKLAISWQAKCSKCGDRVEPIGGFYLVNDWKRKDYEQVKVKKDRIMKTAINRKTEIAEDEMLYSVEAIRDGIIFIGDVVFEDGKDKIIKDALKDISSCRLGGATSRGYGGVEIEFDEEVVQDELSLGERVKLFNDKLKECWDTYKPFIVVEKPYPQDANYFTVDLQSDAIFHTSFGIPTTILTSQFLVDTLKGLGFSDIPEVELVRTYSVPKQVSGWSEAWKLPKDVSLAAKAGSVFVFKTLDFNRLIEPLEVLEEYGLGERIKEGYGRVLICDPFHLEVKGV